MKNERIQKIQMCVRTYINLYGTTPEIREMVDWTGFTYEEVSPVLMAELKPEAGSLAA